MKKTRKHYTGEEKVAILRRHLLELMHVAEIPGCKDTGDGF